MDGSSEGYDDTKPSTGGKEAGSQSQLLVMRVMTVSREFDMIFIGGGYVFPIPSPTAPPSHLSISRVGRHGSAIRRRVSLYASGVSIGVLIMTTYMHVRC